MEFEDYIARYRMLALCVENEKRYNSLFNDKNYISFLNRVSDTLSDSEKKVALPLEETRISAEKHSRLLKRYVMRLSRACGMIAFPPVREYALLRYVYGIKNENIAASSFYSVRSIYRHSCLAKKELYSALIEIMPKCRRDEREKGGKYRPSHSVTIKDYSVPQYIRKKLAFAKPTSVAAFKIKSKPQSA